MSTMSTADTFDRWLEGQLRHELLPLTAAAAPAARYASSRPGLWSLRLSLATAIAVAALLITGTGALAATVTGSVNLSVWGEQLRDCGLVLSESGHSFSECFSDLTRKQEKGGSGVLPTAPAGKERDIDRPVGPVSSPPAAAGDDRAGGGAPETNPARTGEGDEGLERGDDRESGRGKGEDRKKGEPEKGDSEKGDSEKVGGGGRD
jgi:hypothetical protein